VERNRKDAQADEPAGAPEWMVTFSDCMTLLLTFFVLLLSFSSFDERVFLRLTRIFGEALPSVRPLIQKDKSSFLPAMEIAYVENLNEGSEKPTLAEELEENLKEDTEPVDFRRRKVFIIASRKIFWGKGVAISFWGRRTLSTIASFLKEVPSRVVIGENGPGDDEDSEELGLERAWAVMEYLITKQGLDKRMFSITAASTIAQESREGNELSGPGSEHERVLEIVLLERSICN